MGNVMNGQVRKPLLGSQAVEGRGKGKSCSTRGRTTLPGVRGTLSGDGGDQFLSLVCLIAVGLSAAGRSENEQQDRDGYGKPNVKLLSMSFAKSLVGFKISKIRKPRVTCYMDEYRRRTQLLRSTAVGPTPGRCPWLLLVS